MRIEKLVVNGLFLLGAAALSACGGGGGGGGSPAPAPVPVPVPNPPVSTDFGGTILAKVARTGVAGTWGYTAPDGGRYAIMGTAKGVLVLDLRDTANVKVVDEIDGPTNTSTPGIYWREMRVYGHYAYIVSELSNFRPGVMILDLAGLPNSVRFVKSMLPRDGDPTAHTIDIDMARGLMYLQRDLSAAAGPPATASAAKGPGPLSDPGHEGQAPDKGSIEIWDIKTDPENPRYVTTFNQFKNVHDMTAVGDFVYVAEGDANSFSIWNVKTPTAPTLVTRWAATGYAHNMWPNGAGTHVVTTEEVPAGLPARVWQLNGSVAPTQVSSFKIGTGTPHNVIMEGNMAYLSHYSEGAAVVDLSNPAVPRVVAQVDTNTATGSALNGCWGVYKFPGTPLVLCSDMLTGFNLITITGQ